MPKKPTIDSACSFDHVISVDPSSVSTGYAIWERDRIDGLDLSTFVLSEVGRLTDPMDFAEILISPRTLLVIEDQFLGRNPASMVRVVEARVAIETIGKIAGTAIARIWPASWINRITKEQGEKLLTKAGVKSKQGKKNYIEKARQFAGRTLQIDIAAAVCIGIHMLENYNDLKIIYTPRVNI